MDAIQTARQLMEELEEGSNLDVDTEMKDLAEQHFKVGLQVGLPQGLRTRFHRFTSFSILGGSSCRRGSCSRGDSHQLRTDQEEEEQGR